MFQNGIVGKTNVQKEFVSFFDKKFREILEVSLPKLESQDTQNTFKIFYPTDFN